MERNKSFFDDNGVRGYLNGIKDVGAAVNELDKNFLQSLEDQLVSLGQTGKFSFNAIFDTIRNGMIKMAADGLTQSFAKMLFGKGELDGGTPSIFGSTIGKWMGGYQAKQTNPLGASGANPLYVKWAGDYNSMGVSTKTGQFINGKEKIGQVLVGGVAGDPATLNQTKDADGHVGHDADVGQGRQQPARHERRRRLLVPERQPVRIRSGRIPVAHRRRRGQRTIRRSRRPVRHGSGRRRQRHAQHDAGRRWRQERSYDDRRRHRRQQLQEQHGVR
jgi:hypothetical protein